MGKVAVVYGEQVAVGGGPKEGQRQHIAHYGRGQQGDQNHQDGQAAAFYKREPGFYFFLGGGYHVSVHSTGQKKDAHGIDDAQQDQEAVKLAVVEVQGG